MSEINYTYNNFSNYGCMMFDLTDELLAPVMEEVNEIQADFSNGTKFNDRLAGNIRKEFQLTKCFKHLENLILPFVSEYDKHFGYFKTINIWIMIYQLAYMIYGQIFNKNMNLIQCTIMQE